MSDISSSEISPVSQETSLQQIGLDNALAYRDNSAQLLSDSIDEVQRLVQANNDLYPPYFPGWRNADESESLRISPLSRGEGRLSEVEGVATQVLTMEHAVLNQAIGTSLEITRRIEEVLKMSPQQWQADVVGGIGDFGNSLRSASGVREKIINGVTEPQGNTIRDGVDKIMWDRFHDAIKADNMSLGAHTAQAIVNNISVDCVDEIKGIPEGATNDAEIQARIDSRIHGAKLAQALYIEALKKAGNRVSSAPPSINPVENRSNPPVVKSQRLLDLLN